MRAICRPLILLALGAVLAVLPVSASAETTSPGWLRFEPELRLSDEGFRGVRWGTRANDLPWKLKPCHVHTLWRRVDEEFEIFGTRAEYITYTSRNSVLYGVRLDLRGEAQVQRAVAAAQAQYPPLDGVEQVNPREWRWRTRSTSLWVTLPPQPDSLGQVFLWGRDRIFPDDSPTPAFLSPPMERNATGRRYQPRQYVIYRASAPIVIDGRIEEKAWQDAEWTEPFEDAQSPYCPLPWKMTRAKVLHDDENLYFAARLQEENVWGQIAKRDTISYWDNDFEIFVDPTADAVNYFEFEMTALNQMFDMWHENDNHRNALADGTFDAPNMRHAVQVQGTLNYHHDLDDGWTVEVMIPYRDLLPWNPGMQVPPRRGDMWRLNFSRVQYLHVYTQLFPYLLPYSPCEDWVWAATFTGDLHVPEMWAKGVFSNLPAGAVKDEELESPFPLLPAPSPSARPEGMVRLESSRVTLGPDPTDPVHSPGHPVEVPAFWIDRYEVTVAEYAAFLNRGGSDEHYHEFMQVPELCGLVQDGPGRYHVLPGREDYPIVFVTQEDAAAYAASLGKTLPTEAMWERAARGAEGRTYPWGESPLTPERANYDFHYGGTLPVGSLPAGATPEGIHDLAGNVKEWTASRFTPYPGGAPYEHWFNFPFFAPPYPEKTWSWVSRGGSWSSQEKTMASAYRTSHAMHNAGFRCVRLAD
ncbi:MAG: SUMF1/EgtB/PvdO family nonheme iron enzyme [Candidatus Latescibacterota bacterium]|jgi:formylglycine-generating enzyme required for sulfatase activity